VFLQSYSNYEILVCDDDSADQTYDYVKKLEHPAVQLFRNSKHCGYVETMNTLLDLAKGEFIVFLSDDDLLLPMMIEREVEAMDRFPTVGLVAPGTILVNLYGQILAKPKPPYSEETLFIPGKRAIDNFLPPFRIANGRKLYTSFPSTMFRRELVNKVGKFTPNVQVACDLLLESKLCLVSDMAYIPEPMFLYRLHDNWGSTMGRHGLYVREFAEVFESISNFVAEQRIKLDKDWLGERQSWNTNYIFSPSGGMARILVSFEGGYARKAKTIVQMLRASLSSTPKCNLTTLSFVGLIIGLTIPSLPVKNLYRFMQGSSDRTILHSILR
jgi:glycosyltransferase involved in cell wall biosynthesis